MKWVVVANVIAWPVAYYAMNRWIQNFAYRTSIELWIFFLAAFLAFLIALITVGYQAVKTAMANPVDALRYE
jgi:putative ABC transport system permease protein